MVEVNSETDFVARNDLFQGLVLMIANVALDVGTDVEKIKAAKAGTLTVADSISETIAKIGENMSLRRAAELSVGQGAVGGYVHNSVSDGLGKMGVLVALESGGKTDELATLAKLLAQHVAAANPQAVDSASLDPATIAREKAVLMEKAKEQGKPANIIEKMVEGGLKAFYKEVCLVDQAYIRDDKKSVGQVVKEAEATVGAPIKVKGFARFVVGEGIEKKGTDFAAEVAAAAGQPKQ
jgi:elongation factor Ts